jgi:hypothetical protein
MWFLSILLAVLPEPNPKFQIAYLSGYADLYNGLKSKVIAWHKAKLEEVDADYARVQDSLRLIAARELARGEGIGPMDPRYPSIEDVSPRARKALLEGIDTARR